MIMIKEKKSYWYAVYTMPNFEKKVNDSLQQKGIVSYCPLQKVQRQWADRKKILEMPAFRGYVFVNIHDDIRWQILSTNGVLNFVRLDGKPARIPDNEIETVKLFFHDMEPVMLAKQEIETGDIGSVYSGPMMGMQGKVVEVQHNIVLLQIPSLGLNLQVKVQANNIKIASKMHA